MSPHMLIAPCTAHQRPTCLIQYTNTLRIYRTRPTLMARSKLPITTSWGTMIAGKLLELRSETTKKRTGVTAETPVEAITTTIPLVQDPCLGEPPLHPLAVASPHHPTVAPPHHNAPLPNLLFPRAPPHKAMRSAPYAWPSTHTTQESADPRFYGTVPRPDAEKTTRGVSSPPLA